MKKIITSVIVLISLQIAQAQEKLQINLKENQTFSQAMRESLKLDTAHIPYKTLYTRVIGWSNLLKWNSKDTTSFAHLKQSWYDIEHSKNTVTNTLPIIKNKTRLLLSKNVIPIINIDYKFSYINANAIKRGTLRIKQNKIVQTAQRGNPYLIKHINIVGLAIDKVYANTVYQLKLDKNFILSNLQYEHKVRYVIVNTNTNQTYKLSDNQSTNISFTKSGINVLKIIAYNGNKEFVTYQSINVVSSTTKYRNNEIDANEHKLLTSTIPFKGYDETTATTSYADYHIFYHYNHRAISEHKLKKPIIIVDGFDPLDKRSYKKLYNEDLVYGDKKLGEELRKKGYDIIILNFPMTNSTEEQTVNNGGVYIPSINGKTRDGGTDYIERNSFLLVKLIQTINAKLISNGYGNQKLVVVGPSMGGLISRYALAYMEKHNMNHNTGLWISFDSPHLGANIPLALQKNLHFFGYNGEEVDAQEAYEQQLHCPAARQMLIEQLDGLNGTSSFFSNFYNKLKNNGLTGSNGFPVNLRKIALVNGSGKGKLTHSPKETFLTLDAKKWGTTFVKIRDRFMPPTNQEVEYFKGKVTLTGWIYIHPSEIGYTVNNINPNGSMDVMPGGTFDAQATIKDEFDDALPNYLNSHWTIKHNHCFIPLISALAFNNPDFNWSNRIDDRNLVKTEEIPFDDYYVPKYNQSHIELTKQSVTWLFNQLSQNYDDLEILGSNLICSQGYYTIEGLPLDATVTWSSSNNNVSLQSVHPENQFGQGENYAVFKHNYDGESTIEAEVIINGIVYNLSKDIWVGVPDPDKLSFHISVSYSDTIVFNNEPNEGFVDHEYYNLVDIKEFEWDAGDWNVESHPYAYNGAPIPDMQIVLITAPDEMTTDLWVSARARNECGWSDWLTPYEHYYAEPSEENDWDYYSISPNPVNSQLYLNLTSKAKNKIHNSYNINRKLNSGVTINIWNFVQIIKTFTIKQGDNISIPVNDLPRGIYYLEIKTGNKSERHKFIKK